jgi:hypothetical protein
MQQESLDEHRRDDCRPFPPSGELCENSYTFQAAISKPNFPLLFDKFPIRLADI